MRDVEWRFIFFVFVFVRISFVFRIHILENSIFFLLKTVICLTHERDNNN